MRDAIPIGLAYFAVSFTFGMMAASAGVGVWKAALMSLCTFTSTGQFAALPLITSGATYFEMVLTQLVINLRYLLMSFSISQKISTDTGIGKRLIMSYGMTDEIFGISAAVEGELRPRYMIGAAVVASSCWTGGTIVGSVANSLLPASVVSALGIAIYGMFIGIILPPARENKTLLFVIVCAMGLSSLFYFAPVLKEISSGFVIIIVTLVVSVAAAALKPVDEDGEQKETRLSENAGEARR